MRHRVAGRKFNRTSAHREAMLRNVVSNLFEHGRISTTVPKAKEARSLAEKCITLAKKAAASDDPAVKLHCRRQALKKLHRTQVVKQLFEEVAPRYTDRQGGYTRILRAGFRLGDNAPIALFELV
ncbi:MAG: 50S ribosomal protein L17 [Planctomycetota bacterium]|nr:MAG: 50S ribosomal protein L17 [Planctomycetota bacterium]